MNCRICGAKLEGIKTTLPFKVRHDAIVIIKGLPVLQCQNCNDYVMEDHVMAGVERIMAKVDQTAELEILDYAV